VGKVAVEGWSYGSYLMVLLNLLVGGGLVAWIKSRPKMHEIAAQAEEKFRADTVARVSKLEADLKEQRTYYEDKLEKLSAAYEAKVDRLQADYEAAARISRHELANAKMRFRALIMLLKRLPNPPDGLTQILDDIEAMEADQARSEAAEKGAVSGAKIIAASSLAEPLHLGKTT
jgi:uncharacterized membrane protein YkoI